MSPSTSDVPLRAKLGYGIGLLRDHYRSARDTFEIRDLWNDLAEYEQAVTRHCTTPWPDAQVVELGYGARPWRLLALRAASINVIGIDVERPAFLGGVRELRDTLVTNGRERALKSLVRRSLFDRADRAAFERALHERGLPLRVEPERMLVGDAADLDLPPGSVDLVYSEDVFEHMSLASLRRVLPKIAEWLGTDGVALIRPNVFTGITGGHALDWSRRSFRERGRRRKVAPWAHLTDPEFNTNTYLNRLSRDEYRALFAEHFRIEEERVKLPNLGREFLSPELAERLADFPDDELFSNQIMFVLTPRH